MPDFDIIYEDQSFQQPPQIPQEWIMMVNKLHPVTAAVVWQVLTGTIQPSTITLAQNSPDRGPLYADQHCSRWECKRL